jgi:putative MATE family efflux protein
MAKAMRDFTEGKIFGQMFRFTIPLILSAFMQQLYNIADNIIVGKFSGDPLALAAVGTTSSVSGLFLNLIIGISGGLGVVLSHAIGAKNDKMIKRTVHTAITLSLILGIGLGGICFFLSRPILILTNTPSELIDSATLYLKIIFLGFPGTALYNFSASILHSTGDSKTSLYALTSSGIINVALNLLFVIGFDMSVAGVALATIIAKYLAAFYTVGVVIARKDKPYALKIRDLTLDISILGRILRYGIPTGIQSCMFSLSNLMITVGTNSLTTEAISAKAIFINLISLANAISSAFTNSAMTFAGQNYGAKKLRRIKRSLGSAIVQSIILTSFGCLLMLVFITPISSLYIASDDPARLLVIEEIKSAASLIFPIYFLCGVMNAFAGVLRGIGVSFSNMIISIVGICGFRILWVFTAFQIDALHTLAGIYLSWPISWIIVTVCFTILLLFKLKNAEREFGNKELQERQNAPI